MDQQQERSLFAMRLMMLRRQAHLTQKEVADHLRLHRTTYTKYETDKATPDMTCLLALANLFGVSVDFLLGQDPVAPEDAVLMDGDVAEIMPDELALLAAYRSFDERRRKEVLLQMQRLEREEKEKRNKNKQRK